MSGLNLSNLLPLLMERKRRKDAEEAAATRRSDVTKAYMRLKYGEKPYGPTTPEMDRERNVNDYTLLASAGMALPSEVLDERPDLTTYFDQVKAPDYVRTAYQDGIIDPKTAAEWGMKHGDKPEDVTEEVIQQGIDLHVFDNTALAGKSAKEIMATRRLVQGFGADVFSRMTKPQGTSGNDKADAIEQLLTGKTYEQIVSDPVLLGKLDANGISYRDISQFYGYDPGAISDAEKSVVGRIQAEDMALKFNFGGELDLWLKGEKENPTLAKYVDRQTGQIKNDVILDEVNRLDKLALEQMGRKSVKVEDIPLEIRPKVVTLLKNGVTRAEWDKEYEQAKKEAAEAFSGIEMSISEDEYRRIRELLPE